ncbi:hypothetical protein YASMINEVIRUS_1250 [Yasminevirus sp. GU-2018]|uniref:Uncharacterized protein n=1 Tax=Yasminevirus sp. GU-2018 TaxID=2420051 RepID=A0A5K0U8P8_9VIRU|nr:hypothetical protein YASMINEVIRUS_643 [Yasminevirus sp. GU-2018]VBB18718.1 hypothetical protein YASMINEVIRUS_1250 [Yasminevirus sp. GU-2018]
MSNQSTAVVGTSASGKSFNSKLIWSAVSAAIFIAVSAPQVYTQTSRITTTASENCPTPEGKFIHAALFFAINYFVMKIASNQKWMNMEGKPDGLLAKYAFYGTLLFFLVSSSDTYRLTGKLISGLANESGCPEMKGVIVHGLVFLVLLVLIMYFPKDQWE